MIHCTTVGNFYLRPSGAVLYQERRTDRDEREKDRQHTTQTKRDEIYYLHKSSLYPRISRKSYIIMAICLWFPVSIFLVKFNPLARRAPGWCIFDVWGWSLYLNTRSINISPIFLSLACYIPSNDTFKTSDWPNFNLLSIIEDIDVCINILSSIQF